MLLEFKTSNYKSYVDEMVFSLTQASNGKKLNYSVQKEKIGNKTYNGLCSAVIYGPNSSGKTNIVGAMDTMRAIVLRGNIKNVAESFSPNIAAGALELVSNCNLKDQPTTFSIKFIENGLCICYSFAAMFGDFLDRKYEHNRCIVNEKLTVNETPIFSRGDMGNRLVVKLPNSKLLKEYFNKGIENNFKTALQIAESGISKSELFLTNGFKSVFAQKLVSVITNWFYRKFSVVYRSDAINGTVSKENPNKGPIDVNKYITDAAKSFGSNSDDLRYEALGDDNFVLCSSFKSNEKTVLIPSSLFESYGTIRFLNEAPLIVSAMLDGGTLVLDEFDASIHPMALMNIVNIFHNDEINKNHAQLVFNTHNPIFLNADLFRRDEIKFVEYDTDKRSSIHYALSDFESDSTGRKGQDYLNDYFISRYGAIKEVDFSPVIEEIMRIAGARENG